MKITASISASNKTTFLQVASEDLVIVNGEETNLIPIPLLGQADGVSPLIGTITKDAVGECTLTVLMQYDPRNKAMRWNGDPLQELQVSDFVWKDEGGNPILDEEGNPQPLSLTIDNFIVPAPLSIPDEVTL